MYSSNIVGVKIIIMYDGWDYIVEIVLIINLEHTFVNHIKLDQVYKQHKYI